MALNHTDVTIDASRVPDTSPPQMWTTLPPRTNSRPCYEENPGSRGVRGTPDAAWPITRCRAEI